MQSSKIKPEHNPWYLLATLFGEAQSINDDVHARNRTAWNRFMAAALTEEGRALLVKEGRCSAEELKPFSTEELSEVKKLFAERYWQATGEARTAGAGTAGASPPFPNLKRDRLDFSNIEFDHPFWVKGFFFPVQTDVEFGWADFSGAIFSDQADFRGATFFGRAVFLGATFSRASFTGATFSGRADFSGATFSGRADFRNTTFSSRAVFLVATFSDQADFSGTRFRGWVGFPVTTFSGRAVFSDVRFSRRAVFSGVTFGKETLFVNAKMKSPTSFEDAAFRSAPPQFFGAVLHEGTVWRRVTWPPKPRDPEVAGQFVDAYERLKLEMDRFKKREDEHHFFALELRSRRVMYGDWQPVSELRFFGRTIAVPPLKIPEKTITLRPRKLFGRSFAPPPFTMQARTIRLSRPASGLAIGLYGRLSDFGRSYVRPLHGLLMTIAVGVPLFWWHFGLSGFWQAVGHSFANTFGVLGFRKDLIDPKVIADLPGLLKLVAASQTIAGIVLLFLFGLAIRNRFRMK
jgi:uncharacterized protein YjbI with pentapeptide repeats